LRALLAPDIRATVSNLSQAIRFLVANDFLEGVETRPGEAEEEMRKREMVVEVEVGRKDGEEVSLEAVEGSSEVVS